jgi:adenosylcobalamin-dependent ribonucleoside-triphosphate reductase
VSTSRFPASAPAAAPVFYRTYSRKTPEGRESFDAVVERNLNGLAKLGKLSESEVELLRKHQLGLTMLPSGRWLWVGGTPWLEKPENFFGAYNCTSLELVDLEAFGLLMDLAMMGCGTGAVLTADNCAQLPPVSAELQIEIVNLPGEEMDVNPEYRDHTIVVPGEQGYLISVGDSRKGWVQAYQELFRIACYESGRVLVSVDLGNVRPAGSLLKGFGGVANPIKLPELFPRVANILNKAVGRQLTPLECCKLIDEAALVVVAGNIRRTAGMRQFDSTDKEAATAKMNLWVQDAEGNWSIDPERDVLRMANHTRVYHTYPSYEEVEEAVRQQYHSGEGAIQFAPEAVARGNADLLSYPEIQGDFIELYSQDRGAAEEMLFRLSPGMSDDELDHRMRRFALNPCAEVLSSDFTCNLSEVHLNQLAHATDEEVDEAFKAAGLTVAVLLHHNFIPERMQRSREWDPIVGVSFTGLFDFFVHRFGVEWLEWWERGRPGYEFDAQEAAYLDRWRIVVEKTIAEYCEIHDLRIPNRSTVVQPAGCLDRSALRVFDQGLLLADELVEPGSGETTSLPLSVRGGIGATTAIANAPLDLVKVVFANGRTLRMTPDHRLSVGGKWVRADALLPGMEIDYSLGEYRREVECPLFTISAETRESRAEVNGHARGVVARTITMPQVMSPKLAYFLGALFGNGCLSESHYRVRFSHGRLDVLHKLAKMGEELFGIEGSIRHEPKRYELCFASKQLFSWLRFNGLAKATKSADIERIPEKVRRSSRSSILAFFAGLVDTDGSPRNDSFSIDTASEDFMRHLQQVGEAVGLCLGLSHNTQGSNFQATKSIWTLHLSRTRSQVDAVNYLNEASIKLRERPVRAPKADRGHAPYKVTDVVTEVGRPDYSYDFAVEGLDDDDAWYWQGALKSHNTKSLLTGASPGWHPPKAQRFIRRITFRRDDPVAKACMAAGYTIVPSQSDKDENGRLLDDPFDPRCTEWLVEIPTEVSWANLPGADEVDISKFSASAQFDFYMQVQTYYTRHNTSATIEFREHEIETLARDIYDALGEGYISAALLARFDASETFPRLPFEPISKERYDELAEEVQFRKSLEFEEAMAIFDDSEGLQGPAGCDSDKCLMPLAKPA